MSDRLGLTLATVSILALSTPAARAAPSEQAAAPLDLQAPFAARSPWRLIVTQGPRTEDYGGNPAPGLLDLCLSKGPAGPCEPISATPHAGPDWGPHYLQSATPVYPHGPSAAPLLKIVTASLHAGDGGQVVVTQLLRYDRPVDAFERVYRHDTGSNNNQEVRFVESGPLMGDVISAEPTGNAPYVYWITVNSPAPTGTYRPILRYRSATRYEDGNALAVIDSDMPNTLSRLGLWRRGQPLPLPADAARTCPNPRLVKMELWCR